MRSAALLILLLASSAPSAAQIDDCSSKKLTAGAAYVSARAACTAKGLAKGVEPDALCIAKALEKLQKGFEKAEAKGGCASLADLSPAEDVLADAVEDGFDEVATSDAVCCAGNVPVCTYRVDAQDCLASGGTPGANGSVCQGDGSCGAESQQIGGPCCEGIQVIKPDLEGTCATGANVINPCNDLDLPFSPDAWCHPGAGCVNASEPARTKCTSIQVKAIGSQVAALLRCHAKAIQKGLPVDLVCLGKAESKLTKAFANGVKKGDCLAQAQPGPAATIGTEATALAVKILHPATRFCCEGVEGCYYTGDALGCTTLGGQPIGTGECDADGTCKAPPLEEGACCQGIPTVGTTLRCVGGTTQVECTNLQGEFVGDALCLMGQVCID